MNNSKRSSLFAPLVALAVTFALYVFYILVVEPMMHEETEQKEQATETVHEFDAIDEEKPTQPESDTKK